MSSRRSRSRQAGARISDDQINELVSRLQEILPELRHRHRHRHCHCPADKVSAAKVLEETCNYIRNLHKEVDGLSDRLSELLETSDTAQAAMIRSLLM